MCEGAYLMNLTGNGTQFQIRTSELIGYTVDCRRPHNYWRRWRQWNTGSVLLAWFLAEMKTQHHRQRHPMILMPAASQSSSYISRHLSPSCMSSVIFYCLIHGIVVAFSEHLYFKTQLFICLGLWWFRDTQAYLCNYSGFLLKTVL